MRLSKPRVNGRVGLWDTNAMENFWKWLKQANARAVLFCLLAALLGVAVWWGWKLTTPIGIVVTPATGTLREQTTPGLNILAYLQAQQIAGTNRPANNLFFPAEASNLIPSVQPNKGKSEPANPPTNQEPRKDATLNKPARSQEILRLTYRGFFVQRDGVPMALISDSKNKRSAFYPAGTNIFGLTLKTIETESLGMTCPDHSTITLKRGVPLSIPEGRYAN